MSKPKGYYTDDYKDVHPVMGKKHVHIKSLNKSTSSLKIPKILLTFSQAQGLSKYSPVQFSPEKEVMVFL